MYNKVSVVSNKYNPHKLPISEKDTPSVND